MDWRRLSAFHLGFVLAVLFANVSKTEGETLDKSRHVGQTTISFLFAGFVSCSPNPCENGARCIKNSLGSARCE